MIARLVRAYVSQIFNHLSTPNCTYLITTRLEPSKTKSQMTLRLVHTRELSIGQSAGMVPRGAVYRCLAAPSSRIPQRRLIAAPHPSARNRRFNQDQERQCRRSIFGPRPRTTPRSFFCPATPTCLLYTSDAAD